MTESKEKPADCGPKMSERVVWCDPCSRAAQSVGVVLDIKGKPKFPPVGVGVVRC